jgi:hypothetical protein
MHLIQVLQAVRTDQCRGKRGALPSTAVEKKALSPENWWMESPQQVRSLVKRPSLCQAPELSHVLLHIESLWTVVPLQASLPPPE